MPDDVAGNRVAEKHEARAHVVEVAVVPDRLPDSERDADGVGQDQRRDAVEDRDGEAAADRFPDGLVVAGRAAEIEHHDLLEPAHVAQEDRLVEAVVDAQLLKLGVGEYAARDAARARERAAAVAAGKHRLVQHPLDRSARHDARDRENEQRDTQEGRDDQQEPADEITGSAHEQQRQRNSSKYPTKRAVLGAVSGMVEKSPANPA